MSKKSDQKHQGCTTKGAIYGGWSENEMPELYQLMFLLRGNQGMGYLMSKGFKDPPEWKQSKVGNQGDLLDASIQRVCNNIVSYWPD